jgi:hypothetical protein
MANPRAQFYRGRAQQMRARAARMASPDIRKDMEQVARQYDLMADHIEETERKKQGDD